MKYWRIPKYRCNQEKRYLSLCMLHYAYVDSLNVLLLARFALLLTLLAARIDHAGHKQPSTL
jgi:hypothetical protein